MNNDNRIREMIEENRLWIKKINFEVMNSKLNDKDKEIRFLKEQLRRQEEEFEPIIERKDKRIQGLIYRLSALEHSLTLIRNLCN